MVLVVAGGVTVAFALRVAPSPVPVTAMIVAPAGMPAPVMVRPTSRWRTNEPAGAGMSALPFVVPTASTVRLRRCPLAGRGPAPGRAAGPAGGGGAAARRGP